MIYEVTVNQGEDIKKKITDFILEQGWKNVYVTGAVGSVIGVEWGEKRVTKHPALKESGPDGYAIPNDSVIDSKS